MTVDELAKLGEWAEHNPDHFVSLECAVLIRRIKLDRTHVEVFLAGLGGIQGPRFLALVDEVVTEDEPKQPFGNGG